MHTPTYTHAWMHAYVTLLLTHACHGSGWYGSKWGSARLDPPWTTTASLTAWVTGVGVPDTAADSLTDPMVEREKGSRPPRGAAGCYVGYDGLHVLTGVL